MILLLGPVIFEFLGLSFEFVLGHNLGALLCDGVGSSRLLNLKFCYFLGSFSLGLEHHEFESLVTNLVLMGNFFLVGLENGVWLHDIERVDWLLSLGSRGLWFWLFLLDLLGSFLLGD